MAELPNSFVSMTMGDAVRAAMERAPDKVALIHGERRSTYRQLVERSGRLRDSVITSLGLSKGNNAAIVARNCIEYIEVVCGVPEAGVAVATVNPRLSSAEMVATLIDCEARVVFCDSASAAQVRREADGGPCRIVEFGPEYEQLLASAHPPPQLPVIHEWEVWTIPYTSGTTGKPKGVLLSHRSRMLVGMIAAAEFDCFGPDGKFLAMTPMNHGGGLAFPAAALSTGGAVEILDKFDPATTLMRLKYGGITGVFMVPTHFQMIFSLPPDILEECRRPPLRAIISNAAPLPQFMKEKIVPYFGEAILHEIYSSTEAGLVTNLRPQDQLRKLSCVGLPFAHTQVKVIRDDGGECAADEVGELFTRSPMLFNGYWNRSAETSEAFRGDWASVGDLARRDEEGYVYIVDRKKNMVISGGVNIYPREIEEILLSHPAIADVAVVGIPDEVWGEKLKTFAVLHDGGTLAADGLVNFCRGKIAPYKIPRELSLVEELPRNANGKVMKDLLREYCPSGDRE